MKKITLIICLMGVTAGAHTLQYTGEYKVFGQCGEYFISSAPAGVELVNETSLSSALVGRGPTDDGAEGCANFKALLECDSKKGSFEISTGNENSPFHGPATVLSFKCI